ncbi:QVPTGV class sortase B protein-sorting domain-containing protein [Streptococcus castoreus]|uniref:QVPTGV class sortase B protein-sorting domain-containing protein n=1 Tax=Streptococcus castoreus TaxID=254786 RepID=UPI0003F8F410|nr:QVPTGV class sortase B protein-sorting domain-containing protein [Streptococcus castoreus]
MKKSYSVLVAGLLFSGILAPSVCAEGGKVPESSVLEIQKTFDIKNDNNITPKTEFTFSIEPKTGTSGTKDGFTVYQGVELPENEKRLKVMYENTDKMLNKVKKVTFDFKKVTFNQPGIYRYTVKENRGSFAGITYDAKTYTVDVYVLQNDKGVNEPKYIVSNDDKKPDAKTPISFTNSIKTTSLKIEKKVTGTAGDRNKDFNFSLTLEPNDQYSAGQKLTLKKTTKDGNTEDIDVLVGTKKEFTLKDGESVNLSNLPYGISYSVDETSVDGYRQSAQIVETNEDSTAYTGTYSLGTKKLSDDTADVITVTNNKEGIVPTGVVSTIAPYAALMLVAMGGAVYLVKKKKA